MGEHYTCGGFSRSTSHHRRDSVCTVKAGSLPLREGCKKSKWKFKMAFAMKGGGSHGGLECHIPILKNDFC